jgi:hypothetical protein
MALDVRIVAHGTRQRRSRGRVIRLARTILRTGPVCVRWGHTRLSPPPPLPGSRRQQWHSTDECPHGNCSRLIGPRGGRARLQTRRDPRHMKQRGEGRNRTDQPSIFAPTLMTKFASGSVRHFACAFQPPNHVTSLAAQGHQRTDRACPPRRQEAGGNGYRCQHRPGAGRRPHIGRVDPRTTAKRCSG